MRTFIAIEIPDEIKKEMAAVQEQLRRSGTVDAGWTRPEGIHLTLKFLGEVPEAKLPEMVIGVRQAAEGTAPFRLEVAGVGAFPNARNARVVWTGVSGEIERLTRLQAAVDEAMAGLGFDREKRKFSPHLTLGRIKYIRSREAWLSALDNVKATRLAAYDVTAISLMKSELRPSGAVYTEMEKVYLK